VTWCAGSARTGRSRWTAAYSVPWRLIGDRVRVTVGAVAAHVLHAAREVAIHAELKGRCGRTVDDRHLAGVVVGTRPPVRVVPHVGSVGTRRGADAAAKARLPTKQKGQPASGARAERAGIALPGGLRRIGDAEGAAERACRTSVDNAAARGQGRGGDRAVRSGRTKGRA